MSQMPLNPKLSKEFDIWLGKHINSIALMRKKCLIVDLDNTLWSGVLGEDGVEGIKMSGDYPGKAYRYWQEGLKELARNGIILAICSKNNEDDVRKMWQLRNDMVLKESDFSCCKINWTDKATNIRAIAADLNIGLDSMVFVDDNPTERELIRQTLPMVEVPEWPEQIYNLPLLYQSLVENYFRVYSITEEDKKKTEQYRQNASRAQAQAQFTNMEDFLRSLDIQMTVAKANSITVPRIAQMTQKTNQFNLTTKRYTDADIQRLINDGALIYTLSVADKFGDNGITGCIILCRDGENWNIDTLLLSCRILGKGIEYAFVRDVLRRLGDCAIKACYLPTDKNAQVKDFYDKVGLKLVNTDGDGNERWYESCIGTLDLTIKDYYKITE